MSTTYGNGLSDKIRARNDTPEDATLADAAPAMAAALRDADEWMTAYVEGVGAEWEEMRENVRKALRLAGIEPATAPDLA